MASKSIAFTFFSAALAGGMLLAGTAWAAPPSPAADPALVYINRDFAIEVSNANGTAKTVLLPQGGLRRPSWAPGGDCTSAPCLIVYEAPICQLRQFDLVMVAGVPTVQNNSPISTVGADSACAAEISPMGDKLVFGEGYVSTGFSSLWTMDVVDGRVDPNTNVSIYSAPAGSKITWSTYNNDGSRIAIVEDGPAPDYLDAFKIIDVATGGSH